MTFVRLAARIAVGAAAGTFVAVGLVDAVWDGASPVAHLAVHAVVAGLVAYAAAHAALAGRLAHARAVLADVRQHRFGPLDTPPPGRDFSRGDELDALVRGLQRTGLALEKEIAELRRAENYRREFLGNVSHELKTPIFAIQGFSETLLDGALDDDRVRRAFVEKILRNVTRLQALTRDLTELARLETGELRLSMAPVNLGRLAAEVVESSEPAAQARGVEIALDEGDDGEVPAAWGDRDRLRQVVSNLVDNAVKYTRSGGRVAVRVRQTGPQRVELSVADTGVGIAPQHVPRLTERFYRVDTSRSREVGGTGLGLAIVKHILAAHDERLDVTSEPGEGSTFRFGLRLAPSRPSPPGSPSRTSAPSAP